MKELGKIDTVTKDYMRDPVIFADAFNKYLYHGRQVIRPEDLKEIDTTEIAVPYGEGGAGVPEQKYRDVLKLAMTDGTIAYCILGCEDQGAVHYAMPVKNMVYDAMQLAHQVTEAAKSHRQKKKAEKTEEKGYRAVSGEFLGGFYKTDKLIPVLTLVIYWGPEKWDGPLSLREMYTAADETVMRYVPDYKVSLIAPEQITDAEMGEFKTSLKEVMLYIKYSKDRDKLQEIIKAEAGFRSLDRQAAEVINVTTNSKLKYPEGKGTVDVCAAIEEMRVESELKGRKEGKIEGRKEGKIEGRKEGKKEGIIEGAVKTYKEFGVSLQETVRRIADRYKLSLQESEEKVAEYWK